MVEFKFQHFEIIRVRDARTKVFVIVRFKNGVVEVMSPFEKSLAMLKSIKLIQIKVSRIYMLLLFEIRSLAIDIIDMERAKAYLLEVF